MSGDRAARLYRRLLRLAPPGLREKHAGEMEELFLDRLGEARSRGRVAVALVILQGAADLLGARAREARFRRLRREWPGPVPARRTLMLGSDVRYAVRSLLRQRLGTALVVAMLAVGIAANVAVFGLIEGLFLRPFPFPEPERLVYINEAAPRWNLEEVGINFPDLDHWQKEQRVFEALAFYDTASFNASDGANADRIAGALASHDFQAVLGLEPILGRFFTPEEDRKGGPPVVVIGQGLWKERFGGDPDVLGRTLRLDGVAHTIIGVMPGEADFPGGVRLWAPYRGDPNPEAQSYTGQAMGRMKAGVTPAQAQAELLRVHQDIWEARDKEKVVSPFVRPLRERFVRDFRLSASALASAVALLLLVRLEKDAVLSRLWSTQPGRLDWNGEFVRRMVVYGALPVVTLFATFFPEVGQSVFSWLEPVKKVMP
jgi:hypothetical protein